MHTYSKSRGNDGKRCIIFRRQTALQILQRFGRPHRLGLCLFEPSREKLSRMRPGIVKNQRMEQNGACQCHPENVKAIFTFTPYSVPHSWGVLKTNSHTRSCAKHQSIHINTAISPAKVANVFANVLPMQRCKVTCTMDASEGRPARMRDKGRCKVGRIAQRIFWMLKTSKNEPQKKK